jgi:hypothetical protein
MTELQMMDWAKILHKPNLSKPPFYSTDFKSLSPIIFYNPDHLRSTLLAFKPDYKKGRKVLLDNSQANKDFELANKMSGVVRGKFEHGR